MQHVASHPADSETSIVRMQTWAAYVLAWVAAFADAIGFITLQQLGASYMSGNSMSSGVALGRAEWTLLLNHGLPILSFVVGVLLGIVVLALMHEWGMKSAFAVVFGLEGICMLMFLRVGSSALQQGVIPSSQPSAFYTCIILLTVTMGLQTATIRKISGQGVHTTFITGVLTSLTDASVQYASWLYTQTRARRFRAAIAQSTQQPAFRHMLLLGGVWGWYLVGAACGSFLEARLSLSALLLPLGILVVLIVVDLVQPFDS